MTRYEKAKSLTKKYRNILKPCSFCGNSASIVIDRSIFGNGYYFSIVCNSVACDCVNCTGYNNITLQEGIKKWNERYNKKYGN